MSKINVVGCMVKGPKDKIEKFKEVMSNRNINFSYYVDKKEENLNIKTLRCNSFGLDNYEQVTELVEEFPEFKICYWVVDYKNYKIYSEFSESGDDDAEYSGGIDYFDSKDDSLFIADIPAFENYEETTNDTRTSCRIAYDYWFYFTNEWYNDKFVD